MWLTYAQNDLTAKAFSFALIYRITSPKSSSQLKVAGHPVRSAAHLRVENEREICHVDLSLRSKCMAEIASQI